MLVAFELKIRFLFNRLLARSRGIKTFRSVSIPDEKAR